MCIRDRWSILDAIQLRGTEVVLCRSWLFYRLCETLLGVSNIIRNNLNDLHCLYTTFFYSLFPFDLFLVSQIYCCYKSLTVAFITLNNCFCGNKTTIWIQKINSLHLLYVSNISYKYLGHWVNVWVSSQNKCLFALHAQILSSEQYLSLIHI